MFAATSLALGLSVGFSLGLWLLLARVWSGSLCGAPWLALVQVHGSLQLFGFAGLFAMGVGLHAVPRFRGAPPVPPALVWTTYAGTLVGLVVRSSAQLIPGLPGRSVFWLVGGALLVLGTLSFAAAAIRSMVAGRSSHRADELLIGAGICAIPIAALLVAFEIVGAATVVVDQPADDRAIWVMLIGGLSTLVLGVWARLAPGFVASKPANARPLIAGAICWLAGVTALALGLALGPWLLLAGFGVITGAIGVFGAGIARQPLAGLARVTRIGVRSAFLWALVGLLIIAAESCGVLDSYFQVSAARHAIALGFVTLMIYALAARVVPAFLGRSSWDLRLQAATLAVANLGIALRVGPQLIAASGAAADALVGLSGVLAYVALVLFTVNVLRAIRGRSVPSAGPGAAVPMQVRFGPRH